jgi:hypothetical protein
MKLYGLENLENNFDATIKPSRSPPEMFAMKVLVKNIFRDWFVILSALIVLAGCASTGSSGTLLYNEWSDGNYTHSEVYVKQVMVIGAFDNLENRQALENTFVSSFAEIGVGGFSSLDFMSIETEINQDNVKKVVESQPVEAVLVTELIAYDEARFRKGPEFENSYADYSTSQQYFESLGVFDSNAIDRNSPDNFTVSQTVLLRVGLYSLDTGKLVWSASSQSIEPKSATEVIQAVTQQVVARLREKNLI